MIICKNNFSNYGLVYDEKIKASIYGAKQLNKYVEKCCGFSFSKYAGNENFNFAALQFTA